MSLCNKIKKTFSPCLVSVEFLVFVEFVNVIHLSIPVDGVVNGCVVDDKEAAAEDVTAISVVIGTDCLECLSGVDDEGNGTKSAVDNVGGCSVADNKGDGADFVADGGCGCAVVDDENGDAGCAVVGN